MSEQFRARLMQCSGKHQVYIVVLVLGMHIIDKFRTIFPPRVCCMSLIDNTLTTCCTSNSCKLQLGSRCDCLFLPRMQIEQSEIKPSPSRQRDPSSRRNSRREGDSRRSPSPSTAESPLPSLPSNTEELLRGRGQPTQRNAYVSRQRVSEYQPVVPSLPSNTEDLLRLRGSFAERGAASSRSDADLARFCSNLYFSQRQQ